MTSNSHRTGQQHRSVDHLHAKRARQAKSLRQNFEDRDRFEAVETIIAALAEAEDKIERNPTAGLSAPRPYPALRRSGWAWLKAGRYWVAYGVSKPPVIVAVFYETADIPSRI